MGLILLAEIFYWMVGGLESLTEKMLYQAMTIIPQRTHVFSGTLRGNLLLAKPGSG